MEAVLSRSAAVLIDGHVHYYSCFEPSLFLRSAVLNFARHGNSDVQKLLCLTESAPDHWFELLAGQLDSEFVDGWWVRPTQESNSLRLVHDDGEQLLLIAGHQVVSEDDLEVLTIGVREKIADGSRTDALVKDTLALGGVPVLPWGFGKWLGNRGRIVEALVDEFGDDLLLGDNGGRLRFGARPRLLDRVLNNGQSLFSGSDPLPMPGQEHRVGSFGTRLNQPLDAMQPFASLCQQLKKSQQLKKRESALQQTTQPSHPLLRNEGYGVLEAPVAFVRNQFVMQWRKRVHRG